MADALMSPNDSLGNLTSLINLFKGSGTTTRSGTSTTSSNITPQGIQEILNQILGGSQGLAAVASGQKDAGMYGSTTNQLLVNNLITQTAGELAAKQAGTTTTTNDASKTGAQFNPLSALEMVGGLALGKSILGPSIGAAWDKTGIGQLGGKLKDVLFGPSEGINDAGALSPALADTVGASDITGLTGSSVAATIPDSVGITDALAGSLGATSAADTLVGASGLADTAGEAAGASVLTDAGIDAAGSAGVDAALADVGGDAAISAGADVAGFTAADAAATAGTDAVAGSSLIDTIGSFFTDAAAALAPTGWVICTELESQGNLDKELYQECSKKFIRLSHRIQRGYQVWAVPVTKWIRKHPNGLVAKYFKMLARKRCEYLLGRNKNFWGWFTVAILEPICDFIGRFVGEQNWRSLYGKH